MVNIASIFVLIPTCHIWVEKIKKQMWRAENWHLDCSLTVALLTFLKCPERCKNKKEHTTALKKDDGQAACCQDPGVTSLREQQRRKE